MAFRRRKTADRLRSSKDSKYKKTTVHISKSLGELPEPVVLQLPMNPPPASCVTMQWGNAFSTTQPSQGLPVGPEIGLSLQPPTSGVFSNISQIEFQQYWGTTDANGNYFLPASVSLNFSFDLKAYTQSPIIWSWTFWDLYQGIMPLFLRLYSKARIKRADGSIEECYFELKNFISYAGFRYPCFGGQQNQNTYLFCLDDPPTPLANTAYYNFFFNIQQVPIDKCLWRWDGLAFHPPGQSPDMVNPTPLNPFPYGPDANFGLDMNTSIPVLNDFGYGDIIQLNGITAEVNPFWGMNQCSYNIGVDMDGDGVPDDYYGDFNFDPGSGVTYVGTASNVQTLLPSEEKTINIV